MHRSIAWLLLLCAMLFALPATAEESFTMAGYDDSSVGHVWETNLFFQRMEEKTGVHFTFDQSAQYADWQQKKAALLAGGELPDVLFKAELTGQEIQRFYQEGKIIDLKPYLESCMPNLSALLAEHPDWAAAITLPDGSIPALPSLNPLQNNNAMWINTTWLSNLGLEMPTDADSLLEVLRAFKTRDPNMNGKADEIPLSCLGMWDLRFLGHAFGLVSNDYGIFVDETGKVQTTLNTAENRAFLTWLNTLWNEELLPHDAFTTADNLRQITDAKSPMVYGMFLAPTPLSLVPAASAGQYELLPPLTYQGTQRYRDLLGDVIRGAFAVTSACEDPETVLRWVDYLYSLEGSLLAQSGVEGEEYITNPDGTWLWNADMQTVATTILTESTIADGGNAPGYYPAELQLAYDNEDTHRIVVSMQALKELSVSPAPLVYWSQEDHARLQAIQMDLGAYAETAMIRFVTGDVPLTDENWNAYLQELNDRGLQEMLDLWQRAIA